MALSEGSGITNVADAAATRGGLFNTPEKYTTIDTLLDVNKPDVRDELIKAYGDQGITGFLKLTGAIRSGGTADFVQWYEEGRRHTKLNAASYTAGTKKLVIDKVNGVAIGSLPQVVQFGDEILNVGDVLMGLNTGDVFVVLTVSDSSDCSCTVDRMDGTAAGAGLIDTNEELAIIGSTFAQGSTSDDITVSKDAEVRKLTNGYNIIKDMYQVAGSQATNIGYINVGGGDYRWYIKGETETRKRFMDKREMMMLFSEKTAASGTIASQVGGVAGSEGYFAAVAARGITATGDSTARIFDSMETLDNLLISLDKEGAPAEYAMYLDRRTSLDIDDMLAGGVATQTTAGLAGQFGAFNNDADLAVQLGFKSFTRGGYTFHKHDWKLMNDPQLAGGMTAAEYRGAMLPMASVVDPQSGLSAPALEMVYKESNGYSRELEHWVTGGAVIGNKTDGSDVAKFHYRSECQLVTRAANQHVILRGA
tara:strand:- start:15396 stop:16832 length:1437 start_codon:yes stop_codon:yes gene_type:complete